MFICKYILDSSKLSIHENLLISRILNLNFFNMILITYHAMSKVESEVQMCLWTDSIGKIHVVNKN